MKIMKPETTSTNSKYMRMRFQPRDAEVLYTIQDMSGVIAKRQLKVLFWSEKSTRAMEKRLAKLRNSAYVDWPSAEQRRLNPIPEPIIWLEWKGACYLAGKLGIHIEQPKKINENQKRTLQKNLRAGGFFWLREPRWSQLAHDLIGIDIRLTFQHYCAESNHITLEEWRNESEFRSQMDVVDFKVVTRQGKVITKKKGICPDGMLVLVDEQRRRINQPFRARFLLEVDMATHDNPSFGWEKSLAGAAYIKSKVYRERFGNNSGRWLVITTGETRMKNLMRQTSKKTKQDADLFFFTTFHEFFSSNVLRERIWNKCGSDTKVLMLEE